MPKNIERYCYFSHYYKWPQMTIKTPCILLFLLVLSLGRLQAQYWNGQDSLYGNEWISFDQSYFKFKIGNDGFYRLDRNTLSDYGLPVTTVEARHFQFWHLGEEVSVKSTTDGIMGEKDNFIILAKANDGTFDRHLFVDADRDQLNPDYSLFSDSSKLLHYMGFKQGWQAA